MRWLVCPLFFFTFMSFMMSWKSPPKALHSFSIPASIFSTDSEKSFSTSQKLFLPPPWRERNKNFQQSVEKLQKKNQLRLLFNIGSGVTTPRAKSALKKKLFKNSSGKGRRGGTHMSPIRGTNAGLQSADATSRPTWQTSEKPTHHAWTSSLLSGKCRALFLNFNPALRSLPADGKPS